MKITIFLQLSLAQESWLLLFAKQPPPDRQPDRDVMVPSAQARVHCFCRVSTWRDGKIQSC